MRITWQPREQASARVESNSMRFISLEASFVSVILIVCSRDFNGERFVFGVEIPGYDTGWAL